MIGVKNNEIKASAVFRLLFLLQQFCSAVLKNREAPFQAPLS